MRVPGLHEFEAAPYRLLSDADLGRLVIRPSLVVVERMLALQEVERRQADGAHPVAAATARN
jgi:hypothetical protein